MAKTEPRFEYAAPKGPPLIRFQEALLVERKRSTALRRRIVALERMVGEEREAKVARMTEAAKLRQRNVPPAFVDGGGI
jgi:hypothetical protein